MRRHLDALIEGATVPAPADDIELPDTCGVATPLSEMMLASALPTDLPGISLPKLIHPDIAGHPIFRTKEWSRPHFGFRELLADIADKPLRTSAAKQLFTWLVQNPTEFPKQAWPAIKELPIWLDSGGTPRPLSRLCQPKSNALARVLGTALARPHVDIGRLRSALSRRRLSLPVRDLPDENEVAGWLTSRINILPLGQVLGLHEALRYRRLARDLAILTNSPARASLARMSPPPTLARDGTLRRRTTVVSPSAAVDRLDLLPEHVAANRSEAGGKTWPMLDAPTGEMARAALITDPGNSAALLARLKVIADHVEAGDLGISNLLCIPHYGGLLAPNALAFKGNRGDYWGSFRLPISGKNLSQTDQNLFRRAGVLPAEPNPETSRAFFAWLREDASRIEIQLPQIIRHFAHERGATGWWGIYDSEPCLPVDTARGVELVGHRAATRARSVYVKDHQALARAILADPGPIMLAIDKHEQVTSSITHILLKAGVRSLRHQTRDPMHVTGAGVEPAPTWVADILATLTSKRTAKSLEKQLDQYGVTSNLIHAHWPSRLAAIKRIVTAAQVVASYRLGHRQVATEVDHAFDAEQGTLWLKLTGNEMRRSVETALFAAFAERVFVEVAPLWCGPALAAALHADIVEAKAAPVEQASAKIEGVLYSDDHDDEDEEGEPGEAPSGHYDWVPDPSKNLPNPGDLPDNDGKPKPDKAIDKDRQKKRERPSVAGEEAQIRALKQDHYAFHCQISLASSLPGKLAPRGSYVDLAENRSQMIDAHHPDYAGASGARHAGNLLILSHAEHHRIGRKLSREQIRRALQTARPHNVVFRWGTQTRNVDGVIADVVVHSTGEVVSIFFTLAHRDYWLR